ncbi:MAG: phosphotransferase family protein [Chloroflexia bacterium]
MLTQSAVAQYLLQRDLVSPRIVVEGDLSVSDFTRRNANFKVAGGHGPGFLLKQGVDEERRAMLAHEARVYRLLGAAEGGGRLQTYLPRLHLYNPDDSVLVLELLDEAETLDEYHARLGRFPTGLAALLGDALGTLHAITEGRTEGEEYEGISRRPAWMLSIHRPNVLFMRTVSNANLKLIKIVQQFPEFRGHLDALRGEWRADTLIHGDLKWANCLVYRPGEGRSKKLKLVDWEHASVGDPCYDAGSVFNDYLSFWLLSIPITGDSPPDRFMQLARYPLDKMQPAIGAFWRAYVRVMGLDPATAAEWLVRATRYAGARLVHTAYEHGQLGYQITGNAVCFLQLGLNILQRPREAAATLLGIAPSPLPGQVATP